MKMKNTMKKASIITLLAMPLLLSSCSINIVRVREPRFARAGSEIAFSDFYSQLEELRTKNDLFLDANIGDKVLSIKNSEKETDTTVRNWSEIRKNIVGKRTDGTVKYDCDNLTLQMKGNTFTVTETKNETDDSNSYTDEETEELTFVTKYGEDTVCATANIYAYTATINKVFAEGDDKKQYVESQYKLAASLGALLPFYAKLPSQDADESVLADYHFYRNGKYFTYVLEKTEATHLDDGELGIYADGEIKTYFKAQVEITNNKIATKAYMKTSRQVSFNFDYEDNREGDVNKLINEQSMEISSVSKAVKIKPIDLSKFDVIA